MTGIARLGDCCTGHDACPPRAIITGSANTYANGLQAVRVSADSFATHGCVDHAAHSAVVSSGSTNTYINGYAVARIGDPVSCGGSVAEGSSNIFVGG